MAPMEYTNGSTINCLSCAADLVAIGDANALTVLQVDEAGWVEVASCFIGTPVLALAFSPNTISPSADPTNWRIQLAVANADGHIRRCTQLAQSQTGAEVEIISNGATTHQQAVTSLVFSASSNGRYLASTSLDRTCIVWDLKSGNADSPDSVAGSVAWPTKFAHPLLSVSAHPKTAEFLVADAAGSIFLLEWAKTGLSPIQLVDPRALADTHTGAKILTGHASWKASDSDYIGATLGSRWVIWHLARGGGGKPILSGNGFLEGGHRFRWSPTDSTLFAISTLSSAHGAVLQLYSTQYPNASPSLIMLDNRPSRVQDFDFLANVGLAVAVGRRVHFVPLTYDL